MSLKLLPDMVMPVTQAQINPLMDNLCQLNVLDAGIAEPMQRALGIYLHTWDLWCKSGGRIDYRGKAGRERLKDDACRFVLSSIVTRHGDLPAAHLAIDWSDTQVRLRAAGLALLPSDVNKLLADCSDIHALSIEMEKRTGLLMDYLGKKPLA